MLHQCRRNAHEHFLTTDLRIIYTVSWEASECCQPLAVWGEDQITPGISGMVTVCHGSFFTPGCGQGEVPGKTDEEPLPCPSTTKKLTSWGKEKGNKDNAPSNYTHSHHISGAHTKNKDMGYYHCITRSTAAFPGIFTSKVLCKPPITQSQTLTLQTLT